MVFGQFGGHTHSVLTTCFFFAVFGFFAKPAADSSVIAAIEKNIFFI